MGSLSELAGDAPRREGLRPGGRLYGQRDAPADGGHHSVHDPPTSGENPSVLNSSRKKRIAAGSGTQVVDVNRLLKQFEMLQSLTKQFSGGKMPRNMRKLMGKKGGLMGGGMPGGPPSDPAGARQRAPNPVTLAKHEAVFSI